VLSFDFLSPAPLADLPARGPLLDAVAEAAAVREVRDGWELLASFADPAAEAAACAEADLSHLAKLELQSSGPGPNLSATLGLEPGDPARRLGEGWLCLEARSLALAIGADGAAVAELAPGARVTDLTAALGAVAIVGPLARDLFARFCALDMREAALPIGDFRPVSVARTPGFVLRQSADRFLILFGAALGEYVWTVLADAAGHLGGRPVGVDALSTALGAEVTADA
jgi:heterotetrameric sarcosine oxidase gamma subunit